MFNKTISKNLIIIKIIISKKKKQEKELRKKITKNILRRGNQIFTHGSYNYFFQIAQVEVFFITIIYYV